jgi:hypothetical protein
MLHPGQLAQCLHGGFAMLPEGRRFFEFLLGQKKVSNNCWPPTSNI